MSEVRRKLIFAILFLLSGAVPFALRAEQPLQNKPETKTGQRQIALEGQDNLRDLGGYQTTDGRTVKWGLIYRAGQLSTLSDADVVRLGELKIRTVIDFRGQSEVETRGKDRLPEGVRSISLPISAGSPPKTGKETSAPAASSVKGNDIMLDITRSIMLYQTDVYSALIRELAEPQNRPLLFHCTAGKDRTGVGSAIVLTLLGVPWETVREDYLLSNVYRKRENERDLNNIRNDIAKKQGIPPEQVDMSSYEPMFYVKPEYIDSAYQAVINKYGSMESYLRNGLGISDEIINRLRKELLE
jgi:protein-tyrosine phosphatase